MTKSKLLSTAVLAVFLSAPSAFAADAETDAGAKIVAPLQMTNATPLYFGTIAPSNTANDTVTLSPASVKTCGAELSCLTDDHTAAVFNVTGQADQSYVIELPTSIQISNGAGDTMTVDNFTGSKTNGTLVAGSDDFSVGGTLAVAAGQALGDYTGTFVVAVEYQ